ncbi:5-methylcytosine restriction system specificity protein McrC [Stenotrophomonas sp. CC120222-04]|uniref:5-methylcytosine restriction system specificity protein McrC n=1 Tax=Stenotrophomonas sp. CC120222-04 TaxID=1378088 RepID=UPI000B69F808|nr:5-methylcytosine-specific restriction endonuclease McrBC, regulatory subunit McrC [Stenotrophomonas sp. CC120222-04]
MLTEVILEENRESSVRLSDQQVQALEGIGRRMAGRLHWWGSKSKTNTNGSGSPDEQASVVSVGYRPNGTHLLKFRNVVGVVRLGDLQLQVVPKIPLSHFCHLMGRSEVAPRVDDSPTRVGSSRDLRELVCGWLLAEAERVVRLGLHRDYSEYEEELSEVRGSVQPVPTVLANLSGRVAVHCSYSELDEDAAINRLMKASCAALASDSTIDANQRRRARRLVLAMGPVGVLRESDWRFQATRLHARYSRVLPLAKLVLASRGASMEAGNVVGTCFLVPTPGIVESALRNILANALSPIDVRKRGLRLTEGGITLNPDLVVDGGRIVGDVKYKYFGGDWDRASFNQIVAFASGFEAERGFIVGFRHREDGLVPSPAAIGKIRVRKFAWVASDGTDPLLSESALAEEIRTWIGM